MVMILTFSKKLEQLLRGGKITAKNVKGSEKKL
jgi:hypothetical protein